MNDFARSRPMDRRRLAVAAMAVGGLLFWGLLRLAPESWLPFHQYTDAATRRFAGGMLGRLGLMMSALWLAWPSLARPAAWLPPGVVVILIGALALLALRPRMLTIVIPAIVLLIAIGWSVKFLRQ